MPRAKISDAYGLTIELEAGEASISELGDKALALLAAATAIVDKRPTGPASGTSIDRRYTPDHRDPNQRSNWGFGPVKAETGYSEP